MTDEERAAKAARAKALVRQTNATIVFTIDSERFHVTAEVPPKEEESRRVRAFELVPACRKLPGHTIYCFRVGNIQSAAKRGSASR